MERGRPTHARQRVADLREGDAVRGAFMARDKRLARFSSKPGRFLTFTISDASGAVKAVAWDDGEAIYGRFEEGDIVFVEGAVTSYRGAPQVTIETVRRCPEGEYDPSDFLPRTQCDVAALVANIRATVSSFSNPHLRRLILSFLDDPDFAAAFAQAPAAKSIHQAVIGGLAEHTSNVVSVCEAVSRLYPVIDREMLIAGAILHDIGKIAEYGFRGLIDRTDEGKLIGHIVIGDRMLCERIAQIEGFPRELGLQLRHMLLSHHGQLEWGSPKRPKTIEACALFHADLLDANVAHFSEVMRANPDPMARWSAYEEALRRQVYLARIPPAANAPDEERLLAHRGLIAGEAADGEAANGDGEDGSENDAQGAGGGDDVP